MKVIEFTRNMEITSEEIYSIFLNDKKDFLVCSEHCNSFIYILLENDWTHKNENYEFLVSEKLISLWKQCFIYHCKKHYCNFQFVCFIEEKQR